MNNHRPLPLLVAATVLGLLGLGCLAAVPVLLVAAGTAEQLDDHLGAIGRTVLTLGAIACAVVGVAGGVAAVGVWRCRAWGWIGGVLVLGVVLLGTIMAGASSGIGAWPALLAGILLGIAGMIGLWWPTTRRACGV